MSVPTPDPLEIYSGWLPGPRRTPVPPAGDDGAQPPSRVLEALVTEALRDGPCHVAFSGGADSSAVLAAATLAARRNGLPDPIPLTARFPRHPAAEESEWQEKVVEHLGLRAWRVFVVDDELDVLGPIATEAIRRHGMYVPAPAHTMVLLARQAGAGTLLTGSGGDEILTPWYYRRRRWREIRVMRPRHRAAAWVLANPLPGGVRARLVASRHRIDLPPWLRPEAERRLQAIGRQPPEGNWRAGVGRIAGQRYHEVVQSVLQTFAAGEGVRLVQPLFDPRFLRALARFGPREGFPARGHAFRALIGEPVPAEVLDRRTKATFNTALVGPRSRAFAEGWDGEGVDRTLVDPARLREAWLAPVPDSRALPALQLAWSQLQ